MNTLSLWQDTLMPMAFKGTVLLATAISISLILHRLSAARRYWLWLSAILSVLTLTLALPLLPAWRVPVTVSEPARWTPPEKASTVKVPPTIMAAPPALEEASVSADALQLNSEADSAPFAQATSVALPALQPSAFSPREWLTGLWLAGLGIMLLRLGVCAWRLHRLQDQSQPVTTDDLASLPVSVQDLAHQAGLKVIPSLLLGLPGSVPMVWGLWRTRLMLPDGFQQWSAEKLRAVLLHEFAHLRRRDPLALIAAQLMQAVHWFNPLAWLAVHRLRVDQEHACDDAALAQGMRPSEYAQHLLDLSRGTRLAAPGLGLCALAMARPAPVESRVQAILDARRPRQGISPRWRRLGFSAAFITALPLAMLQAFEMAPVRGRILDRHGEVLAASESSQTRRYPQADAATHLLGYTRRYHYGNAPASVAALTGADGLEKSQDAPLSRGEDLRLTIDHRLQKIAYDTLVQAGVTRGALTVMDPRNGDVLALVSLPSYDPHVYLPKLTPETWERLTKDIDRPLLNRSIRGFVPASAFTVVTALAGGLAGIPDQQHFECRGSVTYGSRAMHCWISRQSGGSHGSLSLSEALQQSCNCFFYQYGNTAGIDRITQMGRLLGFGEETGIGLPREDEGVLPGPAWQRLHFPNERWSLGYTANTSIGQGMLLTTPMQLTVLAATVANGGKVPRPRLLDDGQPPQWRADLTKEGITAEHIETIRQALRDYVNAPGGAGKSARSATHLIAGKAATAQNWRNVDGKRAEDSHGCFIGFAPYERPTLAFALWVQGVKSGNQTCGPIIRQFADTALALPEKP